MAALVPEIMNTTPFADSFYSHFFFPVSDKCKKIWRSPITSCVYGHDFKRRILDNILYEVDSDVL
jgi:hypothetical protein